MPFKPGIDPMPQLPPGPEVDKPRRTGRRERGDEYFGDNYGERADLTCEDLENE